MSFLQPRTLRADLVLLGIAKLMGAAALVVPLPRSLKEWAYAGFTVDFVSAFISHLVGGDPLSMMFMPPVAFSLLMVSYTAYHRFYLGASGL